MARAVLTAISGSSSRAFDAPKTPATESPIPSSERPPCASISLCRSAIMRSIRAPKSPGSRFEARVSSPTRLQNITVTNFRSMGAARRLIDGRPIGPGASSSMSKVAAAAAMNSEQLS